MLAGFWIYDPKKQAHTHTQHTTHAHTDYDWPHIVFSFIELPNRTANALDKCNSDVKNVLRFEIYWNLFAVSYWLGGQTVRGLAGGGGGRESLATHLPIRDLSIYVSNEANRKHFLCLASNLWPVTGPTLSTHSLFQPPLLLTPNVHSPLVVHSAYTVSGVFNAISDFACSAFQICLTNIWPIRNSTISARKYRYEARA